MFRGVSNISRLKYGLLAIAFSTLPTDSRGQDVEMTHQRSLYDVPPLTLVDVPTAGTLPRGNYFIGIRLYQNGGGQGFTDIGLSNRFQLGIAFGGEDVISNKSLNSNPRIGFNVKFRVVDELPYFPAVTVGYNDQGMGQYSEHFKRYAFKSRGFFAVASRSFSFYKWSSGIHGGLNYSLEFEEDRDKQMDLFVGFDAIFYHNMGFLAEYDFAFNDDNGERSDTTLPDISGKGRGYLNFSVKWLFTQNLEIELIARDLFVNRRDAETFAREMRITYIDKF